MLKNLKKVISTIAAVAILASTASAFAVTFPDVDESASYASDVELLVALGVVNGDDNGKFNPDNTVTRAEFAKMVVEALGRGDAASKSTYTKFADAQGHWAAGYIEAGVAAEFINGYDENTFGPDDTVTYAQAVKMLVGAAGYEAWAQQAGGWTAGYMSYGSSLGITTGVTGVTNDTALTRAQCAVLIANAMKAPLLVTDGYNYVGTLNGVVMVPNYVQMDEYGEYWKTMLTEYHNAYEVKGRVVATAKSTAGALENDEVRYSVEDTRNIDGSYIENGQWSTEGEGYNEDGTVKVGATNAADMMFEYTSAVIVKDDDTNEYTLASIEVYGATEAVEIESRLVTDITTSAVKVLKSEITEATKDYKLADNVLVYVNGYEVADVEDDEDTVEDESATALELAENFVGEDNNKFGKVTLLDQTATGSTVTDGKYDVIMIDMTISDRVSDASVRSTKNVVNLVNKGEFSYDPEDEDTTVAFILDGEEIEVTDIQKDDVLTITTTPDRILSVLNSDTNPLKASTSAVAVVTRNTVSGTVTRTSEDAIVVDGVEYEYALGSTPENTKDYTFFLDANGVIVGAKELDANKNYGIVVRAWFSENNNANMMTIITAAGETVTYQIKSGDDLEDYVDAAWDYDAMVDDVAGSIISYKLSNGKIKAAEDVEFAEDTAVTYNARTNKLGGYAIDDATTKILDLSAYIEDEEEAVSVLTTDVFVDDAPYTAYIVDRNSNKVYNFVVVTEGVGNINATSDLAIVKYYVGDTQVDEEDVKEYVVLKNGEEATLYTDASLVEGQIIMYPVTAKKWVKATAIATVFTPGASYEAMIASALAGTLSVAGIDDADREAVSYKGIVYSANMEEVNIFQYADGAMTTAIAGVENLSIAGANIYTYDFTKKANKGYRVEAAGSSFGNSRYSLTLDDAENNVDWDYFDDYEVNAPIVVVREVEDDVTDVFYFIGEYDVDLIDYED